MQKLPSDRSFPRRAFQVTRSPRLSTFVFSHTRPFSHPSPSRIPLGYVWLGGSGWATDLLFSNWAIAEQYPLDFMGHVCVTSVCDFLSPHYSKYARVDSAWIESSRFASQTWHLTRICGKARRFPCSLATPRIMNSRFPCGSVDLPARKPTRFRTLTNPGGLPFR